MRHKEILCLFVTSHATATPILTSYCRHDNDPFNQRRMRTDWTVADLDGLSCEQVEKINESNQRYNDLVEGIEDLNIAIAMRAIDEGTYDRPVKKTKKRKSKRPSTKELFRRHARRHQGRS